MVMIPVWFAWFTLGLWAVLFLARFIIVATFPYPLTVTYPRDFDAVRTLVALVYAGIWVYFMFWPKGA